MQQIFYSVKLIFLKIINATFTPGAGGVASARRRPKTDRYPTAAQHSLKLEIKEKNRNFSFPSKVQASTGRNIMKRFHYPAKKLIIIKEKSRYMVPVKKYLFRIQPNPQRSFACIVVADI